MSQECDKVPVMEFKKDSENMHYFSMPLDSWSPGGTLEFIAKPNIDDDPTNALAVIDRIFTDDDTAIEGDRIKYTCLFQPSDTSGIQMQSAKRKDFIGEFVFTPQGGDPIHFPARDNFIVVTVYASVKVSGE